MYMHTRIIFKHLVVVRRPDPCHSPLASSTRLAARPYEYYNVMTVLMMMINISSSSSRNITNFIIIIISSSSSSIISVYIYIYIYIYIYPAPEGACGDVGAWIGRVPHYCTHITIR